MATSGSVDFSVSRDNIIKAAYQRSGIVGVGLAPSSDQYTEGAILLNSIVKSWSASLGMPLWAIRYGAIFPQSLTTPHSLTLGPSGGHASTEILHTTLTADSAATDTTLTVSSITGFAASDNIGIELDNGNIDWTTINGAPSGTTITITAGVTTLASSGNHVWGYTSKIDRPLRILEAWTRDYTSETSLRDIPIEIITPSEYNTLTEKSTESYPLKLCYEVPIDRGVCRYWPGFSDGSKIIYFRYHRVLEDFDATGDTPDFPQEYYLPIIFELALQVAPQYGISVEKLTWLERQAEKYLKRVASNDYEEGSIKFYPVYPLS